MPPRPQRKSVPPLAGSSPSLPSTHENPPAHPSVPSSDVPGSAAAAIAAARAVCVPSAPAEGTPSSDGGNLPRRASGRKRAKATVGYEFKPAPKPESAASKASTSAPPAPATAPTPLGPPPAAPPAATTASGSKRKADTFTPTFATTIRMSTAQPCHPPSDEFWVSKSAAKKASDCHPCMDVARLAGTIRLTFLPRGSTNLAKLCTSQLTAPCKAAPPPPRYAKAPPPFWDAETGEPTSLPGHTTVRRLLECIDRETLVCQEPHGELLLCALDGLITPARELWNSPLLRVLCPLPTPANKATEVPPYGPPSEPPGQSRGGRLDGVEGWREGERASGLHPLGGSPSGDLDVTIACVAFHRSRWWPECTSPACSLSSSRTSTSRYAE